MGREPSRARRHATVRFRITAIATLAVAAVLVATGVGLVAAQRRVLVGNLDEALAEEAGAIARAWAGGDVPATLTPVGDDDALAQIVVDGAVVRSTANAAGAPPLLPASPRRGEPAARAVHGAPTDASETFRVVTRPVDGPLGTGVVHVAAPRDDIDDNVALLTRSLAVAVPGVTLALAALVWWLVGRTLRPVEAMRREAAGIGGADLARRVPVPAGDDEIARLARTLNAMLGRIEDAAGRQQRFVADASHELRSPLARMRAELEVDLAHPARADPVATHHSVLDEAIGMQALVDDLLVLARSDAGATPAAPSAPVDLDDVVAGEVRRVRAEAAVAVDTSQVGAAQVIGDAARLGRAVGNVLDNAVRHASAAVTVTLDERAGQAVLAVADDGPGIPEERRQEVFERFTRLDGARAASAGGTGLGLAIARDIVVSHGGGIAVDPGHHPGARLVITLPLAPLAPLAPGAGGG
ncbi:MAG TPA: ATP-binding protein [Acidimicrobiales bacterium]|nr:ATP-binding protein [Acidimicrobiales bacterium]